MIQFKNKDIRKKDGLIIYNNKCKKDLENLREVYYKQIEQLDYDIENNRLKLFGSKPVTYGVLL